MPERFTEDEVRELQGYSDSITLAAMTLHEQIELECGPVARYNDEGDPLFPHYTIGTYFQMLAEAIQTEDIDEIESVYTLILVSAGLIKSIPSVDMRQSILDAGDEIIE